MSDTHSLARSKSRAATMTCPFPRYALIPTSCNHDMVASGSLRPIGTLRSGQMKYDMRVHKSTNSIMHHDTTHRAAYTAAAIPRVTIFGLSNVKEIAVVGRHAMPHSNIRAERELFSHISAGQWAGAEDVADIQQVRR